MNPARRPDDYLERARADILRRAEVEAPDEVDVIEHGDSVEPYGLPPRRVAVRRPPGPTPTRAPGDLPQRMAEGRRRGAERGRHMGQVPYGYRSEGGSMVPRADEVAVVRTIFREYLRRRSLQRVLDHLASIRIRTRRGKRWSRSGLSWVLQNRVYVGRVRFGGVWSRGEHEAIVSPIVFNKAQKMLRQNDRKGRKGRKR